MMAGLTARAQPHITERDPRDRCHLYGPRTLWAREMDGVVAARSLGREPNHPGTGRRGAVAHLHSLARVRRNDTNEHLLILQGHSVDCRGRRSALQYHVVAEHARKLELERCGSPGSDLAAVGVDVVMASLLLIRRARVQLTARLADRAAIGSNIAARKVIGTKARGVNPLGAVGSGTADRDALLRRRGLRASDGLKRSVRHER